MNTLDLAFHRRDKKTGDVKAFTIGSIIGVVLTFLVTGPSFRQIIVGLVTGFIFEIIAIVAKPEPLGRRVEKSVEIQRGL